MKTQINKKQIDQALFLTIIGGISLLIATKSWSGLDPFWHIKVGEWIVSHKQVPNTGIFSFTKGEAPWVAHEWLSEVIIYIIYAIGDWGALISLTLFCTIVTLFIIASYTLKYTGIIVTNIFILFSLFLLSIHILPRPHIIALPILTVWTAQLLSAADSQQAPKFWLLPLMMLWSNLHGSFIIGIAFAFFFAFENLITVKNIDQAKHWGQFIILSVIAAGMTPHGWQGFILPFDLLNQNYLISTNKEWASPDFHNIHPLEVWLLSLLALCLLTGFKLPLLRTVFLLGLIHLSLKHARYVADLLSVVSPLLLVHPLKQHFHLLPEQDFNYILKNTKTIVFLIFLTIVTTIITNHRSNITNKEHQFLLQVLDLLKSEQNQLGHVLNSYGTGGLLIYKNIPVFMDGRNELYKDEFSKAYFDAINLNEGSEKLEQLLIQYTIQWTLFETQAKINVFLEHQPDWQKIYQDKHFTIFLLNANILNVGLINHIKLLNSESFKNVR